MSKAHIDSVRLRNFLSFYEGIVDFDSGLTVIIGPNGSGKTSIFHAMKFALGSNQREARYPKWSDFIRHGASTAEVELTVSNDGSSHRFLRKIDRDGIPRAFIDGKRVKAAELRSLVASLGLDIDNTLVFMPQERINALRDMNPIEVRRLVEEGTGLSEIRDRISLQETEVAVSQRRLEEALDESRVVEREIDLLKHDLDRLEKKRLLQEQEMQLDIEVKWATLDDVSTRIANTRQDIEEKEKGLVDILDEQKAQEKQREEKQETAAALETRLGQVQREIGSIEARIDEEKRRTQKLQDDSREILSEIDQLDRELKKEIRLKEKAKDELEKAMAAKESFLQKQKEIDAEIASNEAGQDEIEQELTGFEEWNAKRTVAYVAYKSLQSDIEKKDVLVRSLKERLLNEEAELQSIETRWSHVWEAMEETNEKELTIKKGQLEREITGLNEIRFREANLVSRLQREADDIRVRLTEVSERIPSSVRELKESIAEHGLKSIVGPVIELLTVNEELSHALEALLAPTMAFAFIAQDENDFALIHKLRNRAEAPSPVIMLHEVEGEIERTELPDGGGVEGWFWDTLDMDIHTRTLLRRAFGDVVLTKTSRSATRVATRFGLKAVALDGTVVAPEKGRTVSYAKRSATGLISTAPLQVRLAELERELIVARKKTTEVMVKLEKTTDERERVIELLAQVTRWTSTWERRKKLLESIPSVQERIAARDDELKQLQTDIGKAERELRQLDNTQPPERSRLAGQRSAIRLKIRRLQKDLGKVQSGLRATEQNESMRKNDLKKHDESVKMLSSRLEELRGEMKVSRSEAGSIAETIELLNDSLVETEATQSRIREELERCNEVIRSISERQVELGLVIKDSKFQVLQARKHLRNLEEEQEKLTREIRNTVKPATVRALEIARDGLIRVRHLLDEYKDVSESVAHTESQLKIRLTELESHVVDLKEELGEAEATVKHIREQYHNGMNATLSKVEKNVNDILTSVSFTGSVRFGLALRDGIYGVDFKSKIKGDKYGNISQGSGGERSLIAISLILALQRFNPAPSYALDEVDIFLDATNTESVSKLLYDASRRSQFILFTPAKSTHLLKHADRRIGVVSPGGVDPSVIIESPKIAGN
ncbi:MAG: AAA family ATPase [Candidatus Thorarchaeota archaeon]|jgi:chromosome segregation protein